MHPGSWGGDARLAWGVAGALLFVVLVVLGVPILKRTPGSPVLPMPGDEQVPTAGAVDLTTMPLEEQAIRLFNRVMMSASSSDTADVAFFLPKALIIHEQLAPTDPDGIYHLVALHLVGKDYQSALAKAREGLAGAPDYLLLLAAAAEAAVGIGDAEAAWGYYSHFLRVFDDEVALDRPGYDHHQRMLPVYREQALAFMEQA